MIDRFKKILDVLSFSYVFCLIARSNHSYLPLPEEEKMSGRLIFFSEMVILDTVKNRVSLRRNFMSYREDLAKLIEAKKEAFCHISDEIWGYAESRFQEVKSSNLQAQYLTEQGFRVTQGL